MSILTTLLDLEKLDEEVLAEKIVKVGSKWQVQSEKGRNMGTYTTKEEAEERLRQVHYFKYKNEELIENIEKSFLEYCKDRNINYTLTDDGLECATWRDYIKLLDLLGDMQIPFKTATNNGKRVYIDKQYLVEDIEFENTMTVIGAFNELDKLDETFLKETDEKANSATQISFSTIEKIIKNGEYNLQDAEQLKKVMVDLCIENPKWRIKPTSWPYQLQLMYNAYKLENVALKYLNDQQNINIINNKLASQEILKITKVKLQLPSNANWQFGVVNHDILSSKEQILLPDIMSANSASVVHKMADKNKKITKTTIKKAGDNTVLANAGPTELPIDSDKTETDIYYINAIEVKGTINDPKNAGRFHGANLAFIYVFNNEDKSTAKLYLAIIGGGVIPDSQEDKILDTIYVDQCTDTGCVTINVSEDKYPNVADLEINNKQGRTIPAAVEINAAKVD